MITIKALILYCTYHIISHNYAGDGPLSSSAKEGVAPGSISVSFLSYCSSPWVLDTS